MPDLAPADESVLIPASVKAAAERAAALHAQNYQTVPPKQPEGAAPAAPVAGEAPAVPAAGAAELAAPAAPAAPAAAEPVAPQPPQAPATPTAEELHGDTWAARYNSMKGRWEASQRTVGSMQEQMSELGDELIRTQQALGLARRTGIEPPAGAAPTPVPGATVAPKRVTAQDVEQFGPEFIDLVRRAARDELEPEIAQVNTQIKQTNQKVTKTVTAELYAALDRDVPNWKEINVDPRFKSWVRLPDLYSGQVRGTLLNAAFRQGDASRVTAFFKGFLAEEQATGHLPSAPLTEQPVVAPRTAAVSLDVLAAPGRAKPAGGEASTAADKPVFSRAQIRGFYDDVRRGVYNGRQTEKENLERQIFAAQNEGRVR